MSMVVKEAGMISRDRKSFVLRLEVDGVSPRIQICRFTWVCKQERDGRRSIMWDEWN